MPASLALRQSPDGSRGVRKRVGVALLLAAASISLAIGIADLRTSQRLRDEGLGVKARVSAKHIERSSSSRHHYIDIEYQTATGQIISTRDDVARALYERVRVGDTITARYLPDEPDVHTLGAMAHRDTFMFWVAGLWLALAVVYWLFGSERARNLRERTSS
jgi:hypothetical protein